MQHQTQTRDSVQQRRLPLSALLSIGVLLAVHSSLAVAAESPHIFGIPVDFILFGMTLLGVALFHKYTLQVALTGLTVIILYKLGFTGFKTGDGLPGLPKVPSSEKIDLNEEGKVVGLF